MKHLLFVIICFSVISCNQNQINKKSKFSKQDSEKFEIIDNSSFEVLSTLDTYEQYSLNNKNNSCVFIYTKEDVTFVDEVDYETDYTECLIFEFDKKLESFNFSDDEISNLNCYYLWRAESKLLKKETIKITSGDITGKLIEDDTWEISLNVDTKFKFGSYFDKDESRKISVDKKIKTTER